MNVLKFIIEGFHITGSFMMWMILLLGFAALAITIERAWYLYVRCGVSSSSFMSGISKYLKAGDYAKAVQYAASMNTPLAKGVLAVLQNRGKGPKAAKKALDEVFVTESPKITRFIGYLNIFANLVTLVGLSGTVYGVMVDFDAIANVPVAQRAAALAAGIAIALSATLFALLVAIPSLLAGGILGAKADRIVEEMDEKTMKLMNMIEE